MMWWHELRPIEQEVLYIYGAFFAFLFVVCGFASTIVCAQRRRRRRK